MFICKVEFRGAKQNKWVKWVNVDGRYNEDKVNKVIVNKVIVIRHSIDRRHRIKNGVTQDE